MSVVPKIVFFGCVAVVSVAAGTALSKKAYDKRLDRPSSGFTYAVDHFKNEGIAVLGSQIQRGSKVVIAAREITSGSLLEAIRQAKMKGVKIRVLLDGTKNSVPTRGALGFLRAHGIETRITQAPMNNQFILIDSKALFLSSAPWTPDASKQDGFLHLLASEIAGIKVQRLFEDAWREARNV